MSQPMGSAGSDVGRGGVRRTTVAGLVLALILTGGSAPGTPAFGAARTWTVVAGGSKRGFNAWSQAFHPRQNENTPGPTPLSKLAGVGTRAFLGRDNCP